MSDAAEFTDLVVLFAMAVVAPLLINASKRVRIAPIVLEIVLGMLVGPEILGWVDPGGVLEVFAAFGLALLFFLAGFEIEPEHLRGQPLRLASIAWAGSLFVGLALGAVLAIDGVVLDSLVVGLALTTTALGTLLPILRDQGELHTEFGRYISANGAVGEFFPIVAIALLFAGDKPLREAFILIGFFVLVAGAIALARVSRPAWLERALQTGLRSSNQLPVRVCLLVVALLVWVASELGLDMLLGAFAAGVVVRFATGGLSNVEDLEVLAGKLDGIGFGVFIPIFFVNTGVTFDFDALFESTATMLKVPMFLGLILLARAVPTFLVHRRVVARRERAALALFAATALPLIVAITTIGLDTGRMTPDNATALVAAGMLSVLLFPIIATQLRGAPAPMPGAVAATGDR